MRITGELALHTHLAVIEKEINSWPDQRRYSGRSAKMFTFTALKSVLMAIAAQGSVAVTIPNDIEITRHVDPIEITREVGPIEIAIQTAPAKTAN